MITTTEHPDVLIICATTADDQAEVEMLAGKVIRRGGKVTIFAESQGKRGLICSLRPLAGRIFLSTERGSAGHDTALGAITAGISSFATAFEELSTWSRPRRDND